MTTHFTERKENLTGDVLYPGMQSKLLVAFYTIKIDLENDLIIYRYIKEHKSLIRFNRISIFEIKLDLKDCFHKN